MDSLKLRIPLIGLLLAASILSMSANIIAAQETGKIVYTWVGDIYVMNVDGSGDTRLTADKIAGQVFWSPDGTKIVYESAAHERGFEIYTMNSDGSNQIRLTNNTDTDVEPAWSSDGSKIAFTSHRDGNLEIYVMNADGSNQMNLTNHPSRDISPTWSPDGSKIAFASDRDGNYELYVMNADGSNQVRITNNPALDDSPVWSPDGTSIAFRRVEEGKLCSPLYKINPDGSNLVQLTADVCELRQISWLPDSSRVLYQEFSEIYSVSLDGSNQVLYATLPENRPLVGPFDLHLSAPLPSNGRLAFFSNRDGDWEIYSMNPDGTGLLKLTHNPVADRSPDGRVLAAQLRAARAIPDS